ncbi:MAG TPA: hypothetical protein VE642_04380, partial [Pyrinomonadaceae bacterium]|nr:hypothetical protein [Pyrinomonadaceae bacterium]
SAQMRDEEALTQYKVRTEEAFAHLAHAQANTDEKLNAFIVNTDEKLSAFIANTDEKLNAFITNTDEKLSAFIGAVERLVNERREGKP